MQRRIAELNERARAERPPRITQNVAGTGACFFLSGRLGQQALAHGAEPIASAVTLDRLGWADRCALLTYMRTTLETPGPISDTLRAALQNHTGYAGANELCILT